MPKTATQRMADTRARRRGEAPEVPHCPSCGKKMKATGKGRAKEMSGLCYTCWSKTPDGITYQSAQRALRRTRKKAPSPFRYFGAIPGQEAWPEGPFNRMRLAVSSCYPGKGKPRGSIWVVWSDDVVTKHDNVRQADVGKVTRETGTVVYRDDLTAIARDFPALKERSRHHGHSDIYLV